MLPASGHHPSSPCMLGPSKAAVEVKRSPTPLNTRALAVPAPGAGVAGAAAAREVAK